MRMRCPTPSLLAVYLSVIECRTVSPEWHMRSRRHRGYCIAHAHTYCMLYECITGRGVGAVGAVVFLFLVPTKNQPML